MCVCVVSLVPRLPLSKGLGNEASMYVVCSTDLAQTVLTKCVKAEGNIRSDSFTLNLDFGFIQDVQESRKMKKKLSLSAAIHASSTNLLDPKERYIICIYTRS